MKFSYYPGCTLKKQARKLDIYAREAAKKLGFELEELPDWQCCGAVYPLIPDDIASRLSAVRALAAADQASGGLVTLCSACHQVIKRINEDMREREEIRGKVNNYLDSPMPYTGTAKVYHYLELLRDKIGFDKLKALVTHPLTGQKIGAYYGCLLLRPSGIMNFDDPENPMIMEDFIRAIGADPVIYGSRNECCGAYMSLKETEQVAVMAERILADAGANGTELLITACPLCEYNLNTNQGDRNIRVVYFTELLAMALGIEGEDS